MGTALSILVPKGLAYRVGKLGVRYLQSWFTALCLEGENFRSHFALHFFLKLLGVSLSMKNFWITLMSIYSTEVPSFFNFHFGSKASER